MLVIENQYQCHHIQHIVIKPLCRQQLSQRPTISITYRGGRLHVFTMRNNMDFDYRVPMILTSHRTLYSSRSKNFDYRVPMGLTSSLGVYSWRVGDLDYRVPMILTSTEVHPSRQCLVLQRTTLSTHTTPCTQKPKQRALYHL